jgi:hypothetical protein
MIVLPLGTSHRLCAILGCAPADPHTRKNGGSNSVLQLSAGEFPFQHSAGVARQLVEHVLIEGVDEFVVARRSNVHYSERLGGSARAS